MPTRLTAIFRRRRTALLLTAACWCWFSLLSGGSLGVDTRNRHDVARNILMGNGPVSPGFGTIVVERGGEERRYARYHLGQSLLLVPIHALLVRPLEKALPAAQRDRLSRLFLAVVVFPAFSAAAMALFFLLLRQWGFPEPRALFAALAVAACTPFLWYGASSHETSQVFLLLVAAGVLATRPPEAPGAGWCAFAAGFVATVVTWFKPLLAVDAALLLVGFSMLARARGHRVKLWAGFAVGGAASLALFLGDNWYRFGHPLRTPYAVWFEQHGIEPFSMPLWKGIVGTTVSLDFGMLWICPVAVAAAVVCIARRASPAEFPDLGRFMKWVWAAYASSVLLHATYVSYAGSHAFGSRFQMHLVPFLCIPLAAMKPSRGLIAILILGFAANMAGKLYAPGLEIQLRSDRFAHLDFIEQAPFEFPGLYGARLASVGHAVAGTLDEKMDAVAVDELYDYQRSLIVPDFWYIQEFRHSRRTGILTVVIAIIEFTILIVAGRGLRRASHQSTDSAVGV